jgi:hypothetical protein
MCWQIAGVLKMINRCIEHGFELQRQGQPRLVAGN